MKKKKKQNLWLLPLYDCRSTSSVKRLIFMSFCKPQNSLRLTRTPPKAAAVTQNQTSQRRNARANSENYDNEKTKRYHIAALLPFAQDGCM
jgi:hypothetical protein